MYMYIFMLIPNLNWLDTHIYIDVYVMTVMKDFILVVYTEAHLRLDNNVFLRTQQAWRWTEVEFLINVPTRKMAAVGLWVGLNQIPCFNARRKKVSWQGILSAFLITREWKYLILEKTFDALIRSLIWCIDIDVCDKSFTENAFFTCKDHKTRLFQVKKQNKIVCSVWTEIIIFICFRRRTQETNMNKPANVIVVKSHQRTFYKN